MKEGRVENSKRGVLVLVNVTQGGETKASLRTQHFDKGLLGVREVIIWISGERSSQEQGPVKGQGPTEH